MPNSALPERLQTADGWKGTDDDVWYLRWRMHIKGWFAYGPNAKEWWARWRQFPILMFSVSGRGPRRWESSNGEYQMPDTLGTKGYVWADRAYSSSVPLQVYFSRCQYWTRWSVQIQWPFMFAVHFYPNAKDVPMYPHGSDGTDGKLWFFYFGAHRDGDNVFWFPSAYLGRNWK